jgi:hypothetical protein
MRERSGGLTRIKFVDPAGIGVYASLHQSDAAVQACGVDDETSRRVCGHPASFGRMRRGRKTGGRVKQVDYESRQRRWTLRPLSPIDSRHLAARH